MVVVVEIPKDDPAWDLPENQRERDRLQQQVGRPPLRTDLWVRTTDQFEEARNVVGGIESLVETEGVVLYSRPLDRPPVVRRSPDMVRRANVRGWLEHALMALDRAVARAQGPAVVTGQPAAVPDAAHFAYKSIRCAINAVLVLHQIRSSKQEDLNVVLARVAGVEPGVADWLRSVLATDQHSIGTAYSVLNGVVRELSQDPPVARLLEPVLRRLDRSVVLLGA